MRNLTFKTILLLNTVLFSLEGLSQSNFSFFDQPPTQTVQATPLESGFFTQTNEATDNISSESTQPTLEDDMFTIQKYIPKPTKRPKPTQSKLRIRREKELSNKYDNVKLPCGWQPKDKFLARSYRRLLKESGINKIALHNTFRFYEKNEIKQSLRQDYLTIVDFNQHSSKKKVKNY